MEVLWGPTHSDKEEEEEEMEEEGVDHQPVPEIPALGVGVGGRRVHSPPVSCPTPLIWGRLKRSLG